MPGGKPGSGNIICVTVDNLPLSQFPHLSNEIMIFPTLHGCFKNYLISNAFDKYKLLLLPTLFEWCFLKVFNNRSILTQEIYHFRILETGSIFLIFTKCFYLSDIYIF